MIRANCRNNFTASDFDFIIDTLAASGRQRNILTDLLTDEEARDTILDDDTLLQAVVDNSDLSRFSPYLYFYLLTRRVFLEHDIDDRQMTDYVATLLAEFCSNQRVHNPTRHHQVNYQYLVDMLSDFMEASSTEAFLIRSHLGNYALFITGIFPDNIYRRSTYGRRAPGFDYYEKMGSSSYYWASQHRLALQYSLNDILVNLADRFRQVRVALNLLADEYLSVDTRAGGLDKMLRQLFFGQQNPPAAFDP